jgi:hypothetical protein
MLAAQLLDHGQTLRHRPRCPVPPRLVRLGQPLDQHRTLHPHRLPAWQPTLGTITVPVDRERPAAGRPPPAAVVREWVGNVAMPASPAPRHRAEQRDLTWRPAVNTSPPTSSATQRPVEPAHPRRPIPSVTRGTRPVPPRAAEARPCDCRSFRSALAPCVDCGQVSSRKGDAYSRRALRSPREVAHDRTRGECSQRTAPGGIRDFAARTVGRRTNSWDEIVSAATQAARAKSAIYQVGRVGIEPTTRGL